MYRIFLNDLFQNGQEPQKGEQIYKQEYFVKAAGYKLRSRAVKMKYKPSGQFAQRLNCAQWVTDTGETLEADSCFIFRKVNFN